MAQNKAKEEGRVARIDARAEMRSLRRGQLAQRLAVMRAHNGPDDDDDDDDEEGDGDGDAWCGFDERQEDLMRGNGKPRTSLWRDEYEDDERKTTVTIEEL